MPDPIGSFTPRIQCHIDDEPNKSEGAVAPAVSRSEAQPLRSADGGAARHYVSGASADAVEQILRSAGRPKTAAPAAAPRRNAAERAPVECGYAALGPAAACVGASAAAVASTPSVVGALGLGALAGVECSVAYYQYLDCREGKK